MTTHSPTRSPKAPDPTLAVLCCTEVLPSTSRNEDEDEDEGAFNAASQQYDPAVFKNIRDGWVSKLMATRVDDYTSRQPLLVAVSSWNVAAKKPSAALPGLCEWLQLSTDPHMIVVGLQARDIWHARQNGKSAIAAASNS